MNSIVYSPSKTDMAIFSLGVFMSLSPMLLLVEPRQWLYASCFYLICSALIFSILSRVTKHRSAGSFILVNAIGAAVIGCLASALLTKSSTAMAGILVLSPAVSAISTCFGLILAVLRRRLNS